MGAIPSEGSAMLTDLYQLTMAQAFYAAEIDDTLGCYHLAFRENPFGGGFAVACGLEQAAEWLEQWRVSDADIAYLRERSAADGTALFTADFLDRLATMRFDCDIAAVEEGTVVFPREPLMRITGPLPMCQLVETALLTIVNFQTLVATKAARVRIAAGDDPLMEFGLRRAQGPDGGLSASRAAYVGGCDSTSNVLAGERFGIPVAGTHAHSWVMAFDTEIEAFEAYVDALPNNVTLLVDTYDTLEGVRRAVEVGLRLARTGGKLLGVRIDSGDLAWLSIKAREILDAAGFTDTRIVASNELDEHLIASLKEQGARIDAWGVGTKLVTGWDQPALGGIYKLAAVKRPGGEWLPRMKVSEQVSKMTVPGRQGVRRYRRADMTLAGDMIYDIDRAPGHVATMVDPTDPMRRKAFGPGHLAEELLVPVFEGGRRVWEAPELAQVRAKTLAGLSSLDPSLTRTLNPHVYPVGFERGLHDLRSALVLRSKGLDPGDTALSPDALAEADAAIGHDLHKHQTEPGV